MTELPAAESERWSGCTTAEDLYLELLKRCLTGVAFGDAGRLPGAARKPAYGRLRRPSLLGRRHRPASAEDVPFDWAQRAIGRDWPMTAETMIGLERLDNLHECMDRVMSDGVPGDVMETGVWRGGATIFMRAVLKVAGDTTRRVWVADSFSGLPPPEPETYPLDAGGHGFYTELEIPLEAVKANFSRYGLLDEQVEFLAGWFADTLPTAPIERLAVLRLDGDMYSSTYQVLDAMYPRLSVGGYLIVDDYAVTGCRAAVDDYRRAHDITEPIHEVDWTGVYWRRAC